MSTILLMAEDPKLRRSVAGILRRHGYIVIPAPSAESTDRILDTVQVSVLLADVDEQDGVDPTATLRRYCGGLPRRVRTLILTGRAGAEDLARELGCAGALLKPIQPACLLDRVGEMAARARAERDDEPSSPW
jgi:DNA-binding response OmpR family regulator